MRRGHQLDSMLTSQDDSTPPIVSLPANSTVFLKHLKSNSVGVPELHRIRQTEARQASATICSQGFLHCTRSMVEQSTDLCSSCLAVFHSNSKEGVLLESEEPAGTLTSSCPLCSIVNFNLSGYPKSLAKVRYNMDETEPRQRALMLFFYFNNEYAHTRRLFIQAENSRSSILVTQTEYSSYILAQILSMSCTGQRLHPVTRSRNIR